MSHNLNKIQFHFKVKKNKWLKKLLFLFAFGLIILPFVAFFSYFYVSEPIEDFPVGKIHEVQNGWSLLQVANYLEKEGVIRSAFVFRLYQKFFHPEETIKSGKYVFKEPHNIIGIFNRMKEGISGIDLVNIRVIEGEPNFMVAKRYAKTFDNIEEKKFLEMAVKHEGYLYPDTYSFSPFADEKLVISAMLKNFDKKTEHLKEALVGSERGLEDVMKMAALIEKEAGSERMSIRKKVSGILWNRIDKGMLLQVDAVFSYIYKKHLSRTLYSHLKIDSPYNTYKYAGLTPTPIGNPTAKSIEAALQPAKTKALYYLTGKDGVFYYSNTGSQHLEYKKQYITNYLKPKVEEVSVPADDTQAIE